MKKFQLMMLSVVTAAVLVGCGSSNNGSNSVVKSSKSDASKITLDKKLKDFQVKLVNKEKESEGCSVTNTCDASQEEIDALRIKIDALQQELDERKAAAEAAKSNLNNMQSCDDCLKLKNTELKKLVVYYSNLSDPEISKLLASNDDSISSLIENIRDQYTDYNATKVAVDKETKALDDKVADWNNKTEAEKEAFRSIAEDMLADRNSAYEDLKETLDDAKAYKKSLEEDRDAKKKVLDALVQSSKDAAEAATKIAEIQKQLKEVKKKIVDDIANNKSTDADIKECQRLNKELEKYEEAQDRNVTVSEILDAREEYDEVVAEIERCDTKINELEPKVTAARDIVLDYEAKMKNKDYDQIILAEDKAKREKAAADLAKAKEQKELADKLDAILNPPKTTGATGAAGAGK